LSYLAGLQYLCTYKLLVGMNSHL